MKISLVVAVSDNDVIGRQGTIPWFVRGEQAIFKNVTMGYPIIMGRKTHESLPKTLPGRVNVVVSRNPNYQVKEGSILVGSLQEALDIPEVKSADKVFVIGGQQLFDEALPMADEIHFTRVHTNIPDGDKFFHFDPNGWHQTISKLYKKDEVSDRPFDFEYQVWRRK